jgi:hypothetical protein
MPATMNDRSRQQTKRLRLRMNIGGPPLFEIWMGELCHKELAAKRYKKHKRQGVMKNKIQLKESEKIFCVRVVRLFSYCW